MKLVNLLKGSLLTLTCLSLYGYKLKVINRANEPIYLKYANALIQSRLVKNPCGKYLVFPEGAPLAPNATFEKSLTGLCVGVCFSGIEILNSNHQDMFSKKWPAGKCRDLTLYVTNLKDGRIGNWDISEDDFGEVVDPTRFKAYSPMPSQPISPGGPLAHHDPIEMPQELAQAVAGDNQQAIKEYWEKHPEMDMLNKNVYEQGNMLANLGFIQKYIKANPKYADAVMPGTKDSLLWELIQELQHTLSDDEDKGTGLPLDERRVRFTLVEKALKETIESLLREYRVNPNGWHNTGGVNFTPLGRAILELPHPNIDLIHMLVYAGADINQAGGKYLMNTLKEKTDSAVKYHTSKAPYYQHAYNFLTDWISKKGIILKNQ